MSDQNLHPREIELDLLDQQREEDPGEDCGRWRNGRLDGYCLLAGTEFCDFECPYRDS